MNSASIDRLGWTLVHFLWQGATIAALLAAALVLTRSKSSALRYGLSCAALFCLALCPIATYLALLTASRPNEAGPASSLAHVSTATASSSSGTIVFYGTQTGFHPDRYLPAIVMIWILGVTVLTVRLFGGLVQVERLKRKHSSPMSPDWQSRLNDYAKRLGYHRKVRLLESAKIDVPVAMGFLRAVIILPCSLATRMSSLEIEAILLHELAHLRRHDYLVNIAQTVVETALFYHPAVWWISRTIRIERENCCDDIAASASANPIVYARALTILEEVRGATPNLSLSAKGGLLVTRINRILRVSNSPTVRPRLWPVFALLLTLTTVLGTIVKSAAQTKPPTPATSSKHATTHAAKPAKTVLGHVKKSATATHAKPQQSAAKADDYEALVQDWLNPKSDDWAGVQGGTPAGGPIYVSGDIATPTVTTPLKVIAQRDDAPKHAAKPKSTVDGDFLNCDLAQALQTIGRQSGISYVVAPNLSGRVSVKVSNVPVIEAINAICFAANATWHKQGDIYYFERQQPGQDTITDRITLNNTSGLSMSEAASLVARLLGAKIELQVDKSIRIPYIHLDNATVEEAMFYIAAFAGKKGNWHCQDGVYTITN